MKKNDHFVGTGKIHKLILNLTISPLLSIVAGIIMLVFAIINFKRNAFQHSITNLFISSVFFYGGIAKLLGNKPNN